MKIVKRIGVVIAALLGIVLVISLFLPKNIHMERSIVINTRPEVPFELVNNIKKWDLWSPWHKKDTAMKKTYTGPVAGVGASYLWESNHEEVGNGKMVVTQSVPYDSIVTHLTFMGKDTALSGYRFTPEGEGVNVTWWINFEMGPVVRIMGLFMDKMLGPEFEKGLIDLKSISESMPVQSALEMKEENIAGVKVVSIREEVEDYELPQKMGEFFGELMQFVQKNDLQLAGPVFALYHGQSGDDIDLETCIPVTELPKNIEGRVKAAQLQPAKAVMYDYYGPYSKLSEVHKNINEWISQNYKKINGSPREVYITDPGLEKDSTKWLTKVYYPVE